MLSIPEQIRLTGPVRHRRKRRICGPVHIAAGRHDLLQQFCFNIHASPAPIARLCFHARKKDSPRNKSQHVPVLFFYQEDFLVLFMFFSGTGENKQKRNQH
tara:strand:+ start:569 stop:871 length:303 start_codon:yes stop_codon:yes gene_type:complete